MKRPILSALAFFGTLGMLSVGYATYTAGLPATASIGTQISSSEWNKIVSALQSLDYRGTTVTVAGTSTAASLSTFSVSVVHANTLLGANPTTSTFSVPRTGTYDISAAANLCTTGANAYISSSLNVNGTQKISSSNIANACGSSTSRLTISLSAWDTVTALCANAQALTMSCYMTVTQLQ